MIIENEMMEVKQNYHSVSQKNYGLNSYDPLTQAYSLPVFYNDFAGKNNFNSLAFIDVDNLKVINDKYGYNCGNEILIFLAFIFKTYKMKIYRLVGDKFASLSEELPSKIVVELRKLKNYFTKIIKKHFHFKATMSVGIVSLENKCEGHFSKYFTEGERLINMSKANGKNKIIYSDDFLL